MKIQKGEYIDFSKLIPRDKVVVEEDSRLELVVRNGRTFWTPVTPGVTINNFQRWEQAFRVFSNIYCKTNPTRATELIEYNHIIHTISQAYSWDNVYLYDKEFRMHMSKNPSRSWGMILQQAWSLRLKDRIHSGRLWDLRAHHLVQLETGAKSMNPVEGSTMAGVTLVPIASLSINAPIVTNGVMVLLIVGRHRGTETTGAVSMTVIEMIGLTGLMIDLTVDKSQERNKPQHLAFIFL